MAAFVQAKRDLGCKAPQVTVLEEGINTENRWAKEFWTLLGGKTQYRGTWTHLAESITNTQHSSQLLLTLINKQVSLVFTMDAFWLYQPPFCHPAHMFILLFMLCVCVLGAGEPEEDELYESGIVDSNGVYRLEGEKLVPHEDAWASIPSVTLLNSKEVTKLLD